MIFPFPHLKAGKTARSPQAHRTTNVLAAAIQVPEWIPENRISCNQCAFVCPHAAIRPFIVTEEEESRAPEGFICRDLPGPKKGLKYRIIVSPKDCYGCSICANVCPAPKKALVMKPVLKRSLTSRNTGIMPSRSPARKIR